MKIWILTSELPFNQPGGIARYVDNFSRFLGQDGHEVTVFCRADVDGVQEPALNYRVVTFRTRHHELSAPWESVEPDAHPSFPYNLMNYWMAASYQYAEVVARYAALEGAPDVIESQEYLGIAYFLLHRRLVEPGFLAGVPVVLNLHSPDFLLRRLNHEPRWQLPMYWYGQMEKFCILAADRLICPSRSMAREVEATSELCPDIQVESFPLPWTEVSSLAPSVPKERHVVYIGRIERRKGVISLLRACHQLWSEGVQFTLSMLGGSTFYTARNREMSDFLSDRYRRWVDDGRLRFEGHLDHEHLLPEVARASVVVIPSLWENFPNTCIEAMSLRKVVVASRHGGQVEMVGEDERAGFLFDWKAEGDFQRQLVRALDLSPQERVRMGETARARVASICAPEVVLRRRVAHFRETTVLSRPLYPFVNRAQRLGMAAEVPAELGGERGLVSILIPFYNLAPYLEEALESALATQYQPKEILILNDGSTDPESVSLLESIRARGLAEVRVVDLPNEGLPSTRNRGAELARGEYLLWLDADDAVEPTFVSKAVAQMERFPNVHWVYSWVRYFGDLHGIYTTWNCELPYLLGHNMLIPVCLLRRGTFLAHGRHNEEMEYGLEDYDTWVRLMAKGFGGLSIPEVLTRYRVRQNSMFRSINRSQMQYLYDTVAQGSPELYRQYGVEIFNLQNANGPGLLWDQPAPWEAPIEVVYSDYHKFRNLYQEKDEALAWNMGEVSRLYALVADLEARLKVLQDQNEAAVCQGEALRTATREDADRIASLTRDLASLMREKEDLHGSLERSRQELQAWQSHWVWRILRPPSPK